MAIVTSANIIAYLGASSYTTDIQTIHEGVEQMVKNQCNRTFESTSYFELYDGRGYSRLILDHSPVTAVSRVSTSLDAVVKVKNTFTDATTASVVVDATNVTLTVSGGAGNSTNALAIATYSTLTLLADAINALSANGWVAALSDSDYAAKKTSLLIPQQIDQTSWVNEEDYGYLYMGEPISFKRIPKIDAIEAHFPRGSQNIAVSYTAGTTPKDIDLAVKVLVKYIYDQKTAGVEGVKSFRVGDVSTEYYQQAVQEIPIVATILANNMDIRI